MKVYVVIRGEYSNQYISAVFTTRELAEAYIEHITQRGYKRDHWQPYRRPQGYYWLAPGDMERMYPDHPFKQLEDVPEETFEHFHNRHEAVNEFGTVAEHELWDVLPVVNPVEAWRGEDEDEQPLESEDELRVG